MRVLFIAVIAALALTSTCNVVAAKNSKMSTSTDESLSARALRGDDFDRRFLKSKNEALDSEERAIEEALEAEDRAVANAKYSRWYNADIKPKQVKMILGVDQKALTKLQRELSRTYVGYYSYYTRMQQMRGSSNEE